MTASVVRHDAKFSPEVVDILSGIVSRPDFAPDGYILDPYAGLGLDLRSLGRPDVHGVELEPEWSKVSRWVRRGDALRPSTYTRKFQGRTLAAIVTSVCYGNRFADQYLGPECGSCSGNGGFSTDGSDWDECGVCGGIGRDSSGRYSYAISLGRKVSEGSASSLQWGTKYRDFHREWLALIAAQLPPGPSRFVLNISDHYRAGERQYVVDWWMRAAGAYGFRVAECYQADTQRMGHGQNSEARAPSEMVIVFDLINQGNGK